MGGFSGTVLTNNGRALQAKAQIGTQLVFTKVKLGSGQLAGGQSLESLTDLITPVMNVSIQSMEVIGDGTTRIRVVVSNEGIATGFYVREVGLYATDPTLGEILYSVSNAGTFADYLPAGGGAVIVEQVLDIITVVGNAASVIANIDDYLVIATKDDVNKQKVRIDTLETRGSIMGRNTLLTGPLSARGAAMLLRDRYSDNLCVGGTPISGGDYAGRPAALAFDGVDADGNIWTSLQNTNVNGVAYVGYSFSVAKKICKIKLRQSPSPSWVTSIKVQGSADGAAWSDVYTATVVAGANTITFASNTAYLFWRVLANSNSSQNGGWSVHELEMYELLAPALADNDLVLQAGAFLSFAAGFGATGPIDYPYSVAADAYLMGLPAVDANTMPLAYTDDLCNGGTALSNAGAAAGVFANDAETTSWSSVQVGAGVIGVSYVGYQFTVAKRVRKIVVQQSSLNYQVPSMIVQYSDNGAAWNSVATYSITTGGYTSPVLLVPDVGAHAHWRVLANGAVTGGGAYNWIVQECEMMEALQTAYVYAGRDAAGVVTYGYTKHKPRTDKSLDIFSKSLATDIYTDNLCVGGAAIASGDSAPNTKGNAFDGLLSSGWTSEVGTAYTTRYIGYDFGVARSIRKLYFRSDNGQFSASYKVQKSTDGSTWLDVGTYTLAATNNLLLLPVGTAARYWRVLGNSTEKPDGSYGLANSFWVQEMTMHEIATDLHTYDTVTGKMNHYDGAAWAQKSRVFLGEAVVDSAGKIVSYKTYDYGLVNFAKFADIRVPDATLVDQPLALGQLLGSLALNGWLQIPAVVNGVKINLIIQWIESAFTTVNYYAEAIPLPIAFPNAVLKVIPGVYVQSGSASVVSSWAVNAQSKINVTLLNQAQGSAALTTKGTALVIGY